MASPKPKSRKRLAEFLKEQQDPFILDLYLLERGYSINGDSPKNKKRDPLFQFSKLLTTLHKKILFHNSSCIVIRDSDIINEHVPDTVPREPESSDQTIEDTDRFSFSTATNSTVYLSCSDIDEDGTLLSPQKDKALFSPNTCQASPNIGLLQSEQITDNEKHQERMLEGGPVTDSRNICVTDATLNQDGWGMEERGRNCCVFVPKKMREDSVLSVAVWSSIIQSAKREKCRKELRDLLGTNAKVCHVLKSKTFLHKVKQVVFYCVREISVNVWRKDCREEECLKESRGGGGGGEELGKVIWERTRELGGNERNGITNLLSLDYLESMDEWSEFKGQVRHICVEIADAVLERVTQDVVAEMIQV